MTRILFFVAAGFAIWWFYRRFTADARKLQRQHKRKRREERNKAHGTLVKDAKTGEYRVRRPDEEAE
jgi:membrane protein implicated in regulation of membrane protease activity